MTLRSRFTVLVTALLFVVLAGAGVAFERLESRRVDASLDRRVLDLVRNPSSLASPAGEPPLPPREERNERDARPDGPARIGSPGGPGDDDPMRGLRGPPPPRRDDGGGPPGPAPGHEEPDDPDAPAMEPRDKPPPPREKGWPPPPAPATRSLAAEPDGARAEVFVFELPREGSDLPWLRAHSASVAPDLGTLDEASARGFVNLASSRDVVHVACGGREYAVTADVAPGHRGHGEPPPPPPPGHGPRGGSPRRPPAPPRLVAVAFLETGPAREAHAAQTWIATAVGIGALCFGALLAFALAGRMLRPIRAAASAAESIATLSQRLPTHGSSDELERLIVVLNGMLARLDNASVRERHFLAAASHELRRPLTALLGELELAAAPGRDLAALRSSVALALDDGRAMRRLVEDLLHHARAQAGALRLAEADVLLSDVVAEAVDRSRRLLANSVTKGAAAGQAAPAAARLEIGAIPAVTLRADPDALRQALENLLVNGAMHGGPGANVRIAAERTPDGLSIRVDDDGPGVPREELELIFEPFGRGDRARSVPGFGLGLAITRDLVVAHGATIDVESPIGSSGGARPGARFTVRWPSARIRAD